MKKIIVSRSALVVSSFSIVFTFGFSLLGLLLALEALIFGKLGEFAVGLLLFCAFFGWCCLMVWVLNRAACVVWIEDGMVKRRGLIKGFYKECSIRAIQTVKSAYVQREVGFGTFLYLVDDRTRAYKKFLRLRKDSYICFRKNARNLAFLRTFWSGKVEE